MLGVAQVHIRLVLLLGAVGILLLLRKPLAYPDRPGSKGFTLTVIAMSLWLASSGLSYFLPGLSSTLVLYNMLLFSITLCFVGWMFVAVEFTTQWFPSRRLLLVIGVIVLSHFVALWANFFGVHELIYGPATTVENNVLVPDRGPGFWWWALAIHVLIALSTGFFVTEAVRSSGLRRRQSSALACTPLPGVIANGIWFSGVVDLTFDPTPVGVAVGAVLLSWALYRTSFLEVVPVGRQTVIEELTDAVVTLDEQHRVVDWNPAARELFTVENPTVGMPATDFFEPVPDETLTALQTTTQTETQVTFELDGRERHFSLSISPIDSSGQTTLGRVLVIRDITAMKQREQQLIEQNESLEEFAGIVSHDIQGPLMEIRGSADIVSRTEDTAHIDDVFNAADRMESLTDNLLRLARHGQQLDDPEPVSLPDVAQSAWLSVRHVNARLVIDTDQTVIADPNRLQQLLENLFRNAIEHVGTDVTVTVGAVDDGFFVEDDGPGIPPDERERAFERGYSSDADGTGFGLEIVRQIATAHGWSVHLTDGETGGLCVVCTDVETERNGDTGATDTHHESPSSHRSPP